MLRPALLLLATAAFASDEIVGDSCLPLDVVTLLRGEITSNLASACSGIISPVR